MTLGRSLRRGAPIALALALLTCGGKSPTAPPTTPPTTRPPATQPTPPPVQSLCQKLGLSPNPNAKCAATTSVFQADVDDAIAKVVREHAEWFQHGSFGLQVLNLGGFYVGVIDNLDGAGACAGFDGEELQVKNSNDFNEQFKISTSARYVVTSGSYKVTCRPAAFPTPPPGDIPPPPGCTLPPSHEIACGAYNPTFLVVVQAAIDEVVQEHPEIFDKNDTAGGVPDGYKVLDINRYHQYVVDAVIKKGFCARFDGEEIVVKNTNEFSDHFDVLTGNSHIRRGAGEYRVSCYPAAF